MNIYDEIGVYATSQLYDLGMTRFDIEKRMKVGGLTRIRRGWYAGVNALPEAVIAAKNHGALGCLSGCKAYGLWVPPESGICVTQDYRVGHYRVKGGRIHRVEKRCPTAIWPLEDCLGHVLRYHDSETALIELESAVYFKKVSPSWVRATIERQPEYKQSTLRFFNPLAQSGSETRTRLFFQRRHVPVTTQFYIPNLGWVDILVGKSLIIECDSYAYHTAQAEYHKDRERDLLANYLGYRVVRLSFRQIWFEWEKTQRMLSQVLERREHRRVPQLVA